MRKHVHGKSKVIRKITEEDRKFYFKDREFDEEAWQHVLDIQEKGKE